VLDKTISLKIPLNGDEIRMSLKPITGNGIALDSVTNRQKKPGKKSLEIIRNPNSFKNLPWFHFAGYLSLDIFIIGKVFLCMLHKKQEVWNVFLVGILLVFLEGCLLLRIFNA